MVGSTGIWEPAPLQNPGVNGRSLGNLEKGGAGRCLPLFHRSAPGWRLVLLSLRPLPILAEDLVLPDFCSGAAGLSGRSMRDFFTGALTRAAETRWK